MSEILVVVEHRQGSLRDVSLELLHAARALGRERTLSVTALVLGQPPDDLLEPVRASADCVVVCDAPELAGYDAATHLPTLASILRQRRSSLTLIAHTATGMDFAPALAVRVGVPLVTDCVAVRWQGDELVVEREIYGGKLRAALTLARASSYLLTMRPGCFDPAGAPKAAASAAVERIPLPALPSGRRSRLVGYLTTEQVDVDIGAASIVVSVGRGLGKPDNLAAVETFAQSIGATLACSRPVADKGWLPKSRQVGTSGRTVRPKLYLALGISGAYQHVAGMRGADTILAVNKDPAAPIFDVAHYGIVGDMFEVLPALQQKLAKR